MNRIQFLKTLDSTLGRFLAVVLPKPEPAFFSACEKVLFIRPGGIGDAVLLVPVLQALQDRFPGASIDVLAEKRNAAIFGLCRVINRVLLYDEGGLPAALKSKYDIVIDTEQWHRLTAVAARLVSSGIKIGYGTNQRRRLYTHAIGYRHDRYELDSFHDLLQPLGLAPPEGTPTPFLTVPEPDQATAGRLLAGFSERPCIVLFPGASIAERRWGADRFHQLAVCLNDSGYPVVVIGGKEDREAGDAILSGVDGLNLAGKTSLAVSAALIEQAALLVSGDSGMLHVGVGLGRPTVSLFGSGIADKWAPRGDRHLVLNRRLPCSPCTRFGTTPPCPIDTRCLREISVEEVLDAVLSLLK